MRTCYLLSTFVMCVCVCVCVCKQRERRLSKVQSVTRSVVSNSLQPHGLQPARLLSSWDSPDKNTGVDGHFLLQGIFPTQGLNPGLSHYRQILSCLSHQRGVYTPTIQKMYFSVLICESSFRKTKCRMCQSNLTQ